MWWGGSLDQAAGRRPNHRGSGELAGRGPAGDEPVAAARDAADEAVTAVAARLPEGGRRTSPWGGSPGAVHSPAHRRPPDSRMGSRRGHRTGARSGSRGGRRRERLVRRLGAAVSLKGPSAIVRPRPCPDRPPPTCSSPSGATRTGRLAQIEAVGDRGGLAPPMPASPATNPCRRRSRSRAGTGRARPAGSLMAT